MSMRAQISLMFDDADLFENFVEPYKQNRMLNGLIIRCLSAYYYNQEVRDLIEGTSLEEVSDGVEIQSQQSICDSIRAALLMQDFLAAELQDTIDGGVEEFDNILQKTNDFATDKGVVKSANSEYGNGVLQLEMKNLQPVQPQGIQQDNPQLGDLTAVINVLVNCVGKLSNTIGNAEVSQMISACQVSNSQVEVPVAPQTVSQIQTTQVPMSQPTQTTTFTQDFEPVVDTPVQQPIVEPVVVDTPVVVPEPVVAENNSEPLEDASDSLKGLLDGVW